VVRCGTVGELRHDRDVIVLARIDLISPPGTCAHDASVAGGTFPALRLVRCRGCGSARDADPLAPSGLALVAARQVKTGTTADSAARRPMRSAKRV